MDHDPASDAKPAGATELTEEFLARLGLSAEASDRGVETAHGGFVELPPLPPLDSSTPIQTPSEVLAQTAAPSVDPAPALEPVVGVAPAFAATVAAEVAPAEAGVPEAAAPPTLPPVADPVAPPVADQVAPPVPVPAAAAAPPAPPVGPPPTAAKPRRNRRLVQALVVGVAAAVVLGVYSMGNKPAVPGISGQTTDTAAGATQAPVDQAKVAELMKKISSNPNDIAALQALGDLYFQAGDYKTASGWEQKILAIDAKNVTALLALGASQFNLGDAVNAEKNWLKVTVLDPQKAEAHYDLGFLYLSKSPPDLAKVKSEWNKVIAIDPKSEVAKTVSAHLKSLSSMSASPSPAATGK